MVQQQMQIMSSITSSEPSCEEVPVEALLLRARNSIYDEELFHELHREARNLTNQGVRSNDGKVSIPYESDKQIEIDLLPSIQGESFQPDNNTCAGIATSLRILLSHAHRQNLRRRVQPPLPMQEGKTPRPTYAILTPVLEHMQHDVQLKSIVHLLQNLREICLKVGFELRIHQLTNHYGLVNLEAEAIQDEFHATEVLINKLTKPRHSAIAVYLPSGLTELKVEIQTSLLPHICGTAYQCTIMSSVPESFISRMQPVVQFSSFAALEDHVLHVLKLDLVAHLAAQPSVENGWTIVSPHDAQLSRINKSTKQSDRIRISLQRNSICLNWKRGLKRRINEGTAKWDNTTTTAHKQQDQGLFATIEAVFKE